MHMLVKRKILDIPADLWAEIELLADRDFGKVTSHAIIHLLWRGLEAERKGKKR